MAPEPLPGLGYHSDVESVTMGLPAPPPPPEELDSEVLAEHGWGATNMGLPSQVPPSPVAFDPARNSPPLTYTPQRPDFELTLQEIITILAGGATKGGLKALRWFLYRM